MVSKKGQLHETTRGCGLPVQHQSHLLQLCGHWSVLSWFLGKNKNNYFGIMKYCFRSRGINKGTFGQNQASGIGKWEGLKLEIHFSV